MSDLEFFLNDGSNKKVLALNDIQNVNLEITKQDNFSYENSKIYNKQFFEFQTNIIDKNICMVELESCNLPDKWTIQFIKFIQARRHKKKRINKKWLKRYGYKKQIIKETKGWHIKCNTDGTTELIKDIIKGNCKELLNQSPFG